MENPIYIMNWHGYNDGAIKSDAPEFAGVHRAGDGNTYVRLVNGDIYNTHPRVTACGWDDDRIEHAPGVYPIRWKLQEWDSLDQAAIPSIWK